MYPARIYIRFILSLILLSSVAATACSDDNSDRGTTFLFLSESMVLIDGSGAGEYQLEIDSDGHWVWEKDDKDDWLTVTRIDDLLYLSAEPNHHKIPRQTNVRVISGSRTATADIIQDRKRGIHVAVTMDLGVAIQRISPNGKYFTAYDSSNWYLVDWDSKQKTLLGGEAFAVSNNGRVVGAVNHQAAYYDPTDQNWVILETLYSEAADLTEDGNTIIGYYIVFDQQTQSSSRLPVQWVNGVMEPLPNPNKRDGYPRQISYDGSMVVGDYSGFGIYWIEGEMLRYLREDMHRTEHIIDTIHSMGYIWELNDLVSFPTRPSLSRNGKFIAGLFREKRIVTYDGGLTYTRMGGNSYTPYIYRVDTKELRLLTEYTEVYEEEFTVMPMSDLVTDDGKIFFSDMVYDFSTGTLLPTGHWVKDMYGLDIEFTGTVITGVAEDYSLLTWDIPQGIGTKSELIYTTY